MPRQVNTPTMRTQVTLQVVSVTTNALGESVETWADDVMVFAETTPVRARELVAAGKEAIPVDTVFRIRYRSGISSTTHRVSWRGDIYTMQREPIDVDGRRMTLEIMATKGIPS